MKITNHPVPAVAARRILVKRVVVSRLSLGPALQKRQSYETAPHSGEETRGPISRATHKVGEITATRRRSPAQVLRKIPPPEKSAFPAS